MRNMANCAIFDCSTSRKEKYKHLSLFKIPGGQDDYNLEWSKKLINVITKTREVDPKLKKLIAEKKLWIYERHYAPTQIIQRKWII